MNLLSKKVITLVMTIVMTMTFLTGCKYFDVETKTLIDYRYSAEHMEYSTNSDGQTLSYHYNEKFELLYEYTYADGHTERHWEECTRFEYQKAKDELGVVES